jgi:hypothetical protein
MTTTVLPPFGAACSGCSSSHAIVASGRFCRRAQRIIGGRRKRNNSERKTATGLRLQATGRRAVSILGDFARPSACSLYSVASGHTLRNLTLARRLDQIAGRPPAICYTYRRRMAPMERSAPFTAAHGRHGNPRCRSAAFFFAAGDRSSDPANFLSGAGEPPWGESRKP